MLNHIFTIFGYLTRCATKSLKPLISRDELSGHLNPECLERRKISAPEKVAHRVCLPII